MHHKAFSGRALPESACRADSIPPNMLAGFCSGDPQEKEGRGRDGRRRRDIPFLQTECQQ